MKKFLIIQCLFFPVISKYSQSGTYNYKGIVGSSPITLSVGYTMSGDGCIATYTGSYYNDK